MAVRAPRAEAPPTGEQAAALLREAAANGAGVRFVGGATKLGWGTPPAPSALELSTKRLDRIVEHNEGDLTAVLEAGVPLASAQEGFAASGQMLALDPPLGAGHAATVGGVLATGDAGPLRHRYGAPRDLVLGVTIALADGSVARAGGKVIKNVAGYDLAKLLCGSFGTLGAIVGAAVRLHPLPAATATVRGNGDDVTALAHAAQALAAAPLEAEALDLAWSDEGGALLVQLGGVALERRVEGVIDVLASAGMAAEVVEDEHRLWAQQRAAQRGHDGGVVVRVSGLPSELPRVLEAARRRRARVVGRAALGLSWITLSQADAADIDDLRAELAPSPCVVLDAPEALRGAVDVWDEPADSGAARLARRVKERFDPAGVCNPGVFIAGI